MKCRAEKRFLKFFGACTDFKVALNKCGDANKIPKRKASLEKAREFQKKWKELNAETAARKRTKEQ